MKRIFTTMLVFCMVLSLLAVGALAAGYTDVAPGAWYEDEVLYCQENGLLDGIGGDLFDPDGTTTRGMLVTALWRLADKPVAIGMDFDDVTAGAYYTEAIAWDSSAKIAEGYGNGKFGPDDLLTREQLVTILFRYAKNIGYDVSVGEDTNILSYDDAFTVSEWAIPAMQWACGDGVIEGIGTTLQPKAAADRAQLAVVLCRFDEKTEEAPVTPTVHFHTYTVNGDGTHTRCCDNVTEACLVDANGKCYTCGYQFVAAIGTEYYNSVSAALAAAAENDTIQLLAGHVETIAFTKATKANLTIVGGEGVTVGTVRLVETTNYGAPEGLTLQNIVFNGEGITSSGTGNSVKDLAVLGCEFTNGAVIHISDGVTDGLTVESCTFRNTDSSVNAKEKTAILVQNNASNVEIKANYIGDCEHNAIQFTKIVGEFSVTDNVIDGTGSRALRLVAKAGAQLNITDNIIHNVNTNPTEAAENNGEIIKISGAVTNSAPLAAINNTIDGASVAWVEDSADIYAYVAKAKIGNVYYASAQAAIAAAAEGDTIKLLAGNTYELIHFPNSTKANLTIEGDEDVYVGRVALFKTTNYGAPAGLTLKNITFNGKGVDASGKGQVTNDLSIVDCDFVDGAYIHLNGDCTIDGLTVENCTFTTTPDGLTAVLVQGSAKNVKISGNTIKNASWNAVQLTKTIGSVEISGNTITNTGSRAIRLSTKDGTVLTITNNVISRVNLIPDEATANAGQVIKVSGTVTDGTFTGNTYGGTAFEVTGGLGIAP